MCILCVLFRIDHQRDRNVIFRGHWAASSRNSPGQWSLPLLQKTAKIQATTQLANYALLYQRGGHSYLTSACEQLCPGAQDGHAL